MQRREPTLDGSAAIEPTAANRPIGRTQQQRRAAPPAPEPERRGGGGGAVLGAVATILAIAGLAAAGFLYNQWQETRSQLVDADRRIAELEKRFELSDEESSASVEVLNAKAKENSAEIRKLWDTRNVNRKGITANKQASDAVRRDVASLSKKIDGFAATVKKIAAVESELAALKQSSTTDKREVTDKLARMERQLASIRSDLTARVGANEEAVESIDAYRRSVNKDLVQLREAIRTLQSGSTTASSM